MTKSQAIDALIEAAQPSKKLPWRVWHYADIRVRVNGGWKSYEGDWLKNLAIALASLEKGDAQ